MTYSQGPRLGKDNNPGNAKWCDEHKRLECKKIRWKGRGDCHAPAIRGTDACKIHGGIRKDVAKAKGQARITAWSALGDASGSIDHKMAVLGVLQMSWLRLAAFSELLRQQVEKDGTISGDAAEDEPSTSGLVGFKYGAAGKEGTIYAVSEEARALVILEAAERDRVVKYAKTAHDMGIGDRLTSLAEKWGDMVATRITLMLEALELTPEQEARVPVLIQAHLGTIEMSSIGSDGS